MNRRDFLRSTGTLVGAGGILSLVPAGIRSAAWAAGSDRPEKILGITHEFVTKYPNTTRAMIRAILQASRHIDTLRNRARVSSIIVSKSYMNAPVSVIEGRMMGQYEKGLGNKWKDPNFMKFFNNGHVNFPYYSHGMWFLTQFRRHRRPETERGSATPARPPAPRGRQALCAVARRSAEISISKPDRTARRLRVRRPVTMPTTGDKHALDQTEYAPFPHHALHTAGLA